MYGLLGIMEQTLVDVDWAIEKAGAEMKAGDVVRHKRQPSFGAGIVLEVYSFHLPSDRAVVMFSDSMVRCKFMTEDLEVINESR